MKEEEVKYKEDVKLLISTVVGEFDLYISGPPKPEDYIPKVHDTITSNYITGTNFYIARIEGEDLYGYYLYPES